MKIFGGEGVETAFCVQQTTDGGYILAGRTNSYGAGDYDAWLIKTDATGDTVWTRTYGGTSPDGAHDIALTSDGGYVVTGVTASYGAGADDVWLLKTDEDGDLVWTRTFGGTSGDYATSIQETSEGGYIVVAVTGSFGAGNDDIWLIKTNAAGDTAWTRTFGGFLDEEASTVQQTIDGGFLITGTTNSFGIDRYDEDIWLIKTNGLGDTLWTRTLGGSFDLYASSGHETLDGEYIITGTSWSIEHGGYATQLVKINASGASIWTWTFEHTIMNICYKIGSPAQLLSDGGIIFTTANDAVDMGNPVRVTWLIKVNSSGETVWMREFDLAHGDCFTSVRQTSDSGYVVAGSGYGGNSGSDVFLLKTDTYGEPEWTE